MNIGERIKQRRVELELSVDEVASRLGKNRATVYRYENSDIENLPTTVLEPLARILQTTPAYLMGYDTPKSKEPTLEQIITNQIKKLGTTLEEVAEEANVAYEWLKNIDSFVPGYMEYMLDDPKNYPSPGCELDWDDAIGAYKSYEWISRVAEVLNLPSSMLRAALAEQENTPDDWDIPLPDDWNPITATEAFGFTNNISTIQSVEGSNPLQPTTKEQNMIKQYRTLDAHGKEVVDFVLNKEADRMKELEKEPLSNITPMRTKPYYQHMASAGSGEYLFDDIPTDQIDVEDTPLSRKADFVLGVNGHSMEPTYNDGDNVLVRKTSDVSIGHIGVFIKGSLCYIKELGEDRLISHNEDKGTYPDIYPDDVPIRVVGEVLGKV